MTRNNMFNKRLKTVDIAVTYKDDFDTFEDVKSIKHVRDTLVIVLENEQRVYNFAVVKVYRISYPIVKTEDEVKEE